MAFRKRFMSPSRGFRRFTRKRAWPWATSIYTNEALAADGTTVALDLLDYVDFDNLSAVALNGTVRVHAVDAKFAFGAEIIDSSVAEQRVVLGWAMVVADDDDTELNFWSASDNLFAERKVLAWGFDRQTIVRAPFAASAAVQAGNQRSWRFSASVKKRFRRPIVLRPNVGVWLVLDFDSAVSSVLSGPGMSGVFRFSVQPAGVGR